MASASLRCGVQLSRVGIVTALAAALVGLMGCGESGGSSMVSQKSTVIIMRHCVRATSGDEVSAAPGFNNDDNYSKDPWPQFAVPAYHCLPRGEELVESQGRWWKSQGGFRKPLHVIADKLPEKEGQRDEVTMQRFLDGLGLVEQLSKSVDHGPFTPGSQVGTPQCQSAAPSEEQLIASVKEHMLANPPPPNYHEQMQRLRQVLGEGKAGGNWTSIECGLRTLDDGLPQPCGACQAAATFSERLLMEWGGNMSVRRGNVSIEEIPKLFVLEMWYFFNWFSPTLVHKYFGASIIRSVLSSLDREGTTIYVGHDSDMMKLKGALGLTWDPAPYPSNSTLPGSMLRLDRDGDQVSVSYLYVSNFSSSTGEMQSVDARFLPSGTGKLAFSDVADRLREGSIEACATGVTTAALNEAALDEAAVDEVVV